MRASIKNNGSKPLPLPKHGFLEAVPEGAEPVALRSWDVIESPVHDYWEFNLVVPPGETLRLDFTSDRLADRFLFQEPRLWKPGQHILRVLLFDSFGTDGAISLLGSVPWPQLFATGRLTAPPIVSPDTPFVVQEPEGVDAEAWAEFMRRSDGVGFARGSDVDRAKLAHEIAKQFPDSAYAPYFAMWTLAPFQTKEAREASVRLYDEAMKRHPNSAVGQLMRNSAVWAKLDEAKNARDLPSGYKLLDEARIELEQLAKKLPRTLQRLQAQKQLKTFPSHGWLAAEFAFRRRKTAE